METIELARKLAALGETKEACRAYALTIHQSGDDHPAEQMEAAAYILQSGGDYRISYTCFKNLYNQGYCQEDILPLMSAVFYEPNVKTLKSRYERNCKLLAKYPYIFRKDFPPFEELPIQFFPYDDHNGYIPFDRKERRFGEFVNFEETVISRNFFKDLDSPILADDVFSQYELEYLTDNVRRSEDIGRENHLYLHYSDWGVFCSYLQCLRLRPILESQKPVFLIEEEISQYPIDFKARFGLDYSQYPVRPIGIREVSRLIWHTQLSTHNGGDFFNEIFDNHPNLVVLPSVMMSNIEEMVTKIREALKSFRSLQDAIRSVDDWPPRIVEELYHLKDRTDRDIMTALFLSSKQATCGTDPASRIAPALFFQPHFSNIVYRLRANQSGRTVLEAKNYDQVRQSPVFRNFKYIKTFTPMRRFTTSHGATVKFMFAKTKEKQKEDEGKIAVVSDAVMQRVLNRSFMIDPEERLYKDSVLVRFEDGKLNPKATFTALAAFLDLPYTESMTYCSENGEHDPYIFDEVLGIEKAAGFDLAPVYRTYDEYVNDAERAFIEYFLRDAYEFYGYGFQYYDGGPVDEEKAAELIRNFSPINHYMRETWKKVFQGARVYREGQRADQALESQVQDDILDRYMSGYDKNRLENAKVLMEGLHFVNQNGQPLRMMPQLQLDPALLEQPLYH